MDRSLLYSDLVAGRGPGSAVDTVQSPSAIRVPDSVIEAFIARTQSEIYPRRALAAETAFIRLRIRYYLAMSAFGVVAAEQVLVEDDAQVARAVEALPEAGRLTLLAERARRR